MVTAMRDITPRRNCRGFGAERAGRHPNGRRRQTHQGRRTGEVQRRQVYVTIQQQIFHRHHILHPLSLRLRVIDYKTHLI